MPANPRQSPLLLPPQKRIFETERGSASQQDHRLCRILLCWYLSQWNTAVLGFNIAPLPEIFRPCLKCNLQTNYISRNAFRFSRKCLSKSQCVSSATCPENDDIGDESHTSHQFRKGGGRKMLHRLLNPNLASGLNSLRVTNEEGSPCLSSHTLTIPQLKKVSDISLRILLPEWLSSVVGSRPFSGGVMSSQMKLLMFSSPR